MNNNVPPEPVLLPPAAVLISPTTVRASFWAANRRRPAFLVMLSAGLAGFLLWLPAGERASLWAGLSTQRTLVSLLFIFALVTISLVWTAGQRLDVRIFKLLNARGYPKWLDRLMWLVTQLGNFVTALLLAGLLFLLNYRRLAFEIIFGTLALWLLVETIKALADRDRPFRTLEKTRVVGWKEIGHSFPSGHTTQIFFLVTLCVYRFQLGPGNALGLYSLAALVGFTRIYVGAHYPRDVVAGVVLGSLWGLLTMLVNPYLLSFHF
jgi:membrane-associated phospholipid phosphatase